MYVTVQLPLRKAAVHTASWYSTSVIASQPWSEVTPQPFKAMLSLCAWGPRPHANLRTGDTKRTDWVMRQFVHSYTWIWMTLFFTDSAGLYYSCVVARDLVFSGLQRGQIRKISYSSWIWPRRSPPEQSFYDRNRRTLRWPFRRFWYFSLFPLLFPLPSGCTLAVVLSFLMGIFYSTPSSIIFACFYNVWLFVRLYENDLDLGVPGRKFLVHRYLILSSQHNTLSTPPMDISSVNMPEHTFSSPAFIAPPRSLFDTSQIAGIDRRVPSRFLATQQGVLFVPRPFLDK